MTKKIVKFKKKKDLYRWPEEEPNDGSYNCGVDAAFSSFKERVDFFYKYFNDMLKFKEEQKQLWKEYWFNNKHTPFPIWLTDYCFGDLHGE
jgi:hypothetical protein